MSWWNKKTGKYADSIKSEIENERRDNMAKKEELEDDFEDIEEEPEEEEIIEEKPRPKVKPVVQKPQERFIAIRQEPLEAVMDNVTNKAQANIFQLLADILNRLEEIKKAVAG